MSAANCQGPLSGPYLLGEESDSAQQVHRERMGETSLLIAWPLVERDHQPWQWAVGSGQQP